MNISTKIFTAIFLTFINLPSFAQCEADHLIILNNFEFVPSELTIAPGETVAFVNIEGEHTLNGLTNSISEEPFNNPFDIFLEQTTGTVEGECMGVVNFDTAGVFNFDCSVGFNAQAGMTLNITVDAFDLKDLMIDMSNQGSPIFESYYVFDLLCDSLLTQSGQWTVFVPNADAVDAIMEYMNLNQNDMSNITNFDEILSYHFAEGRWLAEDLYDGLQLPTAQGQFLNISKNEQGTFVNGAQVTSTNFEAYNGIVHVIDYCLAPQGMPEATVMEIIRQSDSHQIFEDAIVAASLDDELSAQAIINNDNGLPGPWTVFAPTDNAIEVFALELGLSTDELLNSQFLYDFINNHIVNYEIFGEDMYSGNISNTLGGEQIEFEYLDSTFFVIGELNTVEVTVQDLYAFNGVVHVVDAVIKPFIPVLEGSCGVWKLELKTNSSEGWGGDELYLYVNDEYVETLTIFSGNQPRVYEFGIDIDDKIDLYYVENGGSGNNSFKLFSGEGELIVNTISNSNNDYGNASYSNIIACETFGEDFCGKMKVELFNDGGIGWYGSLDVFRNDVFDQAITMPLGYWLITYINSNYDDDFDFVVNNPVYFTEETGYQISDAEGELVVDENETNISPESTYGILSCETISNNSWDCSNEGCIGLIDDSGIYTSLSECQELCVTSSITDKNIEFNIYPNPSSGKFNVYYESKENSISEILIVNCLGEKVFFEEFINPNNNYNKLINLDEIANGIYHLKIKTNNKNISQKIVIQQ